MKKNNLIKKLIKRGFLLILAMFILSFVVFIFSRLAPGDPMQSFYGDATQSMTSDELMAARQRLGLDENIFMQYFHWLVNAFTGNLGISFRYKQPVEKVVLPLIGNTVILGLIAYFLTFFLATILAVISVMHEDGFLDKLITKISTTVYYIPTFWVGVVLVLIFSINLGWFPSSGAYSIGMKDNILNRLSHLILPVSVMVLSHIGYYSYMIRNKLLDEVRKDYVLLAKSKGCTKREIILKHCLRNVLPTIVSLMAISIPHITGGTVVVEAIFNYPGIGSLAINSAKYHDYNLLMVLVLITGFVVFVGSFIAITINEQIDPRMKDVESIKW